MNIIWEESFLSDYLVQWFHSNFSIQFYLSLFRTQKHIHNGLANRLRNWIIFKLCSQFFASWQIWLRNKQMNVLALIQRINRWKLCWITKFTVFLSYCILYVPCQPWKINANHESFDEGNGKVSNKFKKKKNVKWRFRPTECACQSIWRENCWLSRKDFHEKKEGNQYEELENGIN